MDNKRMWAGMALLIGLILLYQAVVLPYLAKKNNWDLTAKSQQDQQQQANNTPVPPPGTQAAPTTGATTGPATTNPAAGTAFVGGPPATQPIEIGSVQYQGEGKSTNPYTIGLKLSQRGASIDAVALNRFRDTYDQPTSYTFQQPYETPSAETRPYARAMATRTVSIDGGPAYQLDSLDWRLENQSISAVSFVAELPGQVRITKTYEVKPADDKTAGYEVPVTYQLANLTDRPIKVKLALNGTNGARPENNRDVPEVLAGFDGGRQNVVLGHEATSSIKDPPTVDLKTLGEGQMLWNGTVSAYFDAIVRPTDANGAPLVLGTTSARLLTPGVTDPLKRAVAITMETQDIAVAPKAMSSVTFNAFFGPKLRDVLKNPYYSSFPLGYDETLVLRSGWRICAACTWDWLIEILVKLLRGLHSVVRDWGLAIIGLVCIVRLLLHPITKKSQISMSRMTKMGPEIERLKKKYGDDEEGFKKAQVEFYREQGIAPFLGCLPMFLQMPIWIALWSSLQSTFEIRHAPFLWGWTWIKDLAQPDHLIALKHPIDIFFLHVDGLNVLPILMGVVFFINQKYQPQPVATTEQQRQQQQMMKYMSIFMFPLFLYASPSGLNLYIFTSTLIGIFESKRIRDHIKEKEDAEKAGVVIVDEPAPKKGDRPATGEVRRAGAKAQAAPTGGITGFMAKLQQMAEEAKKEQERRGKGKK